MLPQDTNHYMPTNKNIISKLFFSNCNFSILFQETENSNKLLLNQYTHVALVNRISIWPQMDIEMFADTEVSKRYVVGIETVSKRWSIPGFLVSRISVIYVFSASYYAYIFDMQVSFRHQG